MKKKDIKETEISILNTNSTQLIPEEEDKPISRKQILKTAAVVVAVVAALVLVLVIGGIVSENIHQKELLREPNESMSAFYAEETTAEIEKDIVHAIVTEAYYTNEEGLQVKLNIANGLKEDQHLDRIYIIIRDTDENGKVIAKGNTDKINKKYRVPAEGNSDFELYIGPRYVADKANSLKKIHYDVTLEYYAAK